MRNCHARVKKAAANARLTFAFFNNHWQGYAPRNAIDMMRALQLPLRELPIQAKILNDDITGKPRF